VATTQARTFGVEEEFLLVDPATGRTAPGAAEVLRIASGHPPAAADAALHTELLATQVEAATGRCRSLDELATQLTHARRQLGAAAASAGLWLVPSGTAVLGGDTAATAHERFAGIADRFAEVVREYQACGCHVHVGVPDLETAVAVVNHLRPWLPTLLALSANSPFHHGRDTGYASWRMIEQARFPGAGVPPWFDSAGDYTAQVGRLVEQGVLLDEAMTFWLARPSAHLPTVEFRVADTAIDVPGALLQAALSRALVVTALAELDRGRTAFPVEAQTAAAALWSAARYGLGGPGVHPVLAKRVPATELLDDLLACVTPALEAAGDLVAVRELVAGVLRDGTGAERQRAVTPADPFQIVRYLTGER
jgi:carboxylate-amine ligase